MITKICAGLSRACLAGVAATLLFTFVTIAYGRGGIRHIPTGGPLGGGAKTPAPDEEDAPVTASAPVLSVHIRCMREEIKTGDEVPIEFTITNRGADNYSYRDVDPDASGRADAYRLFARNAKGVAVLDPRAHAVAGGPSALVATRTLRPGESFVKTVALNRWALITQGGDYYVEGTYQAVSATWRTAASRVDFPSNQITVTVAPRTQAELDAYVDKLADDLKAAREREARDHIVKELMYTASPRIIPTLVESSFDKGAGRWEGEGLLYYLPRTPEIRHVTLDALSKRGLSESMCYVTKQLSLSADEARPLIERSLTVESSDAWAGGALCAEELCDDSFTPRLIAIANDASTPARKAAIYALAMNRTDESVKALKSLLAGDDAAGRDMAKAAIKAAYNFRGKSQGRKLQDDDFDESLRR